MILTAIYSQTKNGLIGSGNNLIVSSRVDMAHFVAATKQRQILQPDSIRNLVIVGRKAYDSLPKQIREHGFDGRDLLVITRQRNLKVGANTAFTSDVKQWLFDHHRQYASANVFVAGGTEIINLLMPQIRRIVLTTYEIDVTVSEPVEAPVINPNSFDELTRSTRREIVRAQVDLSSCGRFYQGFEILSANVTYSTLYRSPQPY